MTLAERRLWNILRLRQLDGFRFRRQYPVGPCIADFACLEAGLIIEVDGGQHMDCIADDARTAFLRREGFHLLRFWNNEVLTNLEGVRGRIACGLRMPAPLPTFPARRGKADQEG